MNKQIIVLAYASKEAREAKVNPLLARVADSPEELRDLVRSPELKGLYLEYHRTQRVNPYVRLNTYSDAMAYLGATLANWP